MKYSKIKPLILIILWCFSFIMFILGFILILYSFLYPGISIIIGGALLAAYVETELLNKNLPLSKTQLIILLFILIVLPIFFMF